MTRFGIRCLMVYLGLVSAIMADVGGYRKVVALRVSFQPDDSPGTTGSGNFLLESETNACGDYTIDPLPHDREYFEAQLEAVNNYFRSVSNDQFGLDLDTVNVFPIERDSSYRLEQSMDYYHPYGSDDELSEERLTELFNDALQVAYTRDSLNFPEGSLVIIFHAGIGQDFSLPFLDPTPEDIPSTFVDPKMISKYYGGPLIFGGDTVRQGILLPETQNHLLFSNASDLFQGASEPCDYQYGLTGTLALMVGFAVGLPPLWDIDSGESGIGVFGLMDQGSNNGRGVIPAPPDAWTRLYAGWETPISITPSQKVTLTARSLAEKDSSIIKIDINENEYFLIENRSNWFRPGVSFDSVRYRTWEITNRYPPLIEIILDSLKDQGLTKSEGGVITNIPNYDLGLPASGLLIWHVDESRVEAGIDEYHVNLNRELRGVDLEEADGAQDIGYPSIFLFTDPSSGYFGDMWFLGNREYVNANPGMKGLAPRFGPFSYPDTRSNRGAASFLLIDDISAPGITMSFSVLNSILADGFPDTTLHLRLSLDYTEDGITDFIGGQDSLWWMDGATGLRQSFYSLPSDSFLLYGRSTSAGATKNNELVAVSQVKDSLYIQRWVFDTQSLNFTPALSRRIRADLPVFVRMSDYRNVSLEWWDRRTVVSEDTVFTYSLSDSLFRYHKVQGSVTDLASNTTRKIIAAIRHDGGLLVKALGESVSGKDSTMYTGLYDTQFLEIGMVDLDLDGLPEILAIDSEGNVYAFNPNLTLVSGFPVLSDAIPPVLAKDLLGDDQPELVVQLSSGDLMVLNSKGEREFYLSNPVGDRLQMLGEYEGRNCIITRSAIWLFDDTKSPVSTNAWVQVHADPANSRSLTYSTFLPVPDSKHLLDKSRTYVYPNPAREGKIIFRVFVESAQSLEIMVYDIAGFFVRRFKLETPVQHEVNEVTWNVTNVEPGVYFAVVNATNGSQQESKQIKLAIIH